MSDPRRFAALTCLAALVLVAAPSSAHVGHNSYCTVQEVAGGLDVKLEVPLALLAQKSEPLLDVEGHVRATTPRASKVPSESSFFIQES